jgi:hypothetical protein
MTGFEACQKTKNRVMAARFQKRADRFGPWQTSSQLLVDESGQL